MTETQNNDSKTQDNNVTTQGDNVTAQGGNAVAQNDSAKKKDDNIEYDLSHRHHRFFMFYDEKDNGDDGQRKITENIQKHIVKILKSHKTRNGDTKDFGKDYHVVLLYDKYKSIGDAHSDKIYGSIASCAQEEKNILMFIESIGGEVGPAYLISKMCQRFCTKNSKKFVVSIARRAKSAATLISLGAKEIHMGQLSQLGPIDPQFGGFPAMALADALAKIAETVSKHEKSAEMFASYLTSKVNVHHLGYYERINNSAVQYATKLLDGGNFGNSQKAKDLAEHFTNHYTDHSFVIDFDEATKYLGDDMVKMDTEEYRIGNEIYEFLEEIDFLCRHFLNRNLRYVGSIEHGLSLDLIEK